MTARRIAALAGSLGGIVLLASCAGAPVAYDQTGAPVPAASYGQSAPLPPPGYGTPTASGYGTPTAPAPYGYQCFAGAYQCRLSAQVPVGSPCSCPGLGATSYGVVR